MRADARANRDALLGAARSLYAERGRSVPLSQIAADAGVGIGTLYRHFPTVDDLVNALLHDIRAQVLAVCRAGHDAMTEDPAVGWRRFVTDLVSLELGAVMPQLVEGIDVAEPPAGLLALRAEVMAEVGRVLELARTAGLVGSNVDTMHFQVGLSALTRPLPPSATTQVPDLRTWLTDVYIAGLRPHVTRDDD